MCADLHIASFEANFIISRYLTNNAITSIPEGFLLSTSSLERLCVVDFTVFNIDHL